jgi:hypothetical protein
MESAMGQAVQHASLAAWSDEAHVRDNRARYRVPPTDVCVEAAGRIVEFCR